MKPKIYIDGKDGTTGLQIYDRLAARSDIDLLLIDEDKRKDPAERKKLMAAADIVFLCLPDAAAVEAVALAEGTNARIIDASTAHRTAPGWVYGFPELKKGQREAIAKAKYVANPGCHATGFIAIAAPLVQAGVLPAVGSPGLRRSGVRAAAGVLLARGVAGPVVFGRVGERTERFRRLNVRYYSPLCVALGVGAAAVGWRGPSATNC